MFHSNCIHLRGFSGCLEDVRALVGDVNFLIFVCDHPVQNNSGRTRLVVNGFEPQFSYHPIII